MPDRTRSLRILAIIQAVASCLIAAVIFVLYGIRPSALNDTNLSLASAILGLIAVVYFVTLHQVLAKTRLALSTLILTIISSANVVLLIASTGGLDSPFYSLWLLAIVVAGIFGVAEIVAALGLTVAYYAYELITQGLSSPATRDHLLQLGITMAAGALAFWVQSHNRKSNSNTGAQLTSLSGKLSTEQLKADTIMASIGEGVMVIDATRKIQLFNQAAANLTGWDGSSADGIDAGVVLQLKTPDDQPVNELSDPFVEAWKRGGTVVRDNLSMTSRSGRKIQLNLSVSPIFDGRHQPSGAIALFRDISREKEVERQKDEFISTASHEMRTPVAAIEGYISLAMNPNVATIDDRAKQYLEKSHETIQHLGQLFKDLLSVTKAEEGAVGGKLEAINMEQILQKAVTDLQPVATKKKLTLVFQAAESSGGGGKAISPLYFVASNTERLQEVVANLIDNAIKFTSAGGVKVTLDGNDKEVTVSVSDTGLGIASEDIPHLFQKFYRIDSTDTRTIGGTGLGLYLCRRVIESFNGHIWVESKLGEGSTFRFKLPRLSQEEVERLQASPAVQPAEGGPEAAKPETAPEGPEPVPAPPPQPAAPSPAPVLAKPESIEIPEVAGDATTSSPSQGPTAPATQPEPAPSDAASPAKRITDITMRRRIR
jgi:PAS domain S-box-containing protein